MLLSSEGRGVARRRIGRGAVTVIAEAAQGFEGDVTLGKLLVRGAASGGADLVKFQLVYVDELATPDYVLQDRGQRSNERERFHRICHEFTVKLPFCGTETAEIK